MSEAVIKVEKLAKRYILSHGGGRGDGLRHILQDAVMAPWRALRSSAGRTALGNQGEKKPPAAQSDEEFWALRDISFDIKRGEVVGIIGRNGAGKSTLLKILSRITEPTRGRIEIDGRVASLLEVGTGFHPELTGRENIFLNGAILGMKRAEIRAKFDQIVEFAEIEKFLDTPVKRYSSGMYVRLAFAVAAFLEPEILIVDEVLAVGDVEFQKKCLGKMKSVAEGEGRTVLFVSHNIAAIATLCSRAILLQKGGVVTDDIPAKAIDRYLSVAGARGEIRWTDSAQAPGNDHVRLQAVRILSEGRPSEDVAINKTCEIEVDYLNLAPGLHLCVSIHIVDRAGVEVMASVNWSSATLEPDEWFGRPFPRGVFRTACTIPANFLNEGRYSVRVFVLSNLLQREVATEEIISFDVRDTGEMRKEYLGQWIGVVRPKLAWRTRLLSSNT